MITNIIVDDHPMIRRGLRALLETQADMNVVGETGNGCEALQMVEQLKPDVTLLDVNIEGLNGIEVAKQLRQKASSTAIVIFSVLGSDHYVLNALRAGAKGYVLKESPADEVIHAIREVVAGRRYLCTSLWSQPCLMPYLLSRLTLREMEVLKCSSRGNTCAEIASLLNISRRTVETHRAHMMQKLGVSSATALYRYAFQQDIVLDHDKEQINVIV